MLILLVFGSVSFSQTASLATVTASPGEEATVPLSVTGFSGIGAITFNIRYNPGVMNFIGIQNTATTGFIASASDSTITIVWTAPVPPGFFNFTDGTLCDLRFMYTGMASGPLSFLGTSEVIQYPGMTQIFPVYTGGAVNPNAANTTKATIVSASAVTGGAVAVPVKFDGFSSNVSAVTLKVSYDAGKLDFAGITTQGTLAGAIADATGGVITITWTNMSGTSINWPTNQIVLNFVFTGNGITNLNFLGGSLIANNLAANIPVSWFSGIVSPGVPTAFATLGSITGVLQGQDIEVPLTLSGFPSGVPTGAAALTLNINYQSPRMSFIGVVNAAQPVLVNQTGSTIQIVWTDASCPDINGTLLKLKFKYNGVGAATVAFADGCLFSDYLTSTIQVGYTNGTVTPGVTTATASMSDTLQASAGQEVLVPVVFAGLPTNMGAATLHVKFESAKLTFIDLQNNTYGATAYLNGNQVDIAWAGSAATDINGTFVKLRFLYNGSGPGCGVNVWWGDGCELADFTATLVPATWNNGGINTKFLISGTLKYNSDPSTEIPLVGFTATLKTNPGDVTYTTDLTDANGVYRFWAPNGSYKIYSSAPSGYIWYSDFADVLAMFDYGFGTPIPYQNALRISAGDVNQNGDIDFNDVSAVFNRQFGIPDPNYIAGDWVYEIPVINCNCANVNQNIMGLNTGNVLGTNATPNP